MRPFSASSSSSRKKITFGSTALQNIRKSFDKFKFQKEQELFSRLQHRIDTEYIKSKAHKDFYKRDTRLIFYHIKFLYYLISIINIF